MKIFIKIISLLISLMLIFIIYLSFFGIETKRLNNSISNKIKNIDENLNLELKKIRIILDPIKFKLNAKTVGSKLTFENKIIELENIKTKISLISLIQNEFSLEDFEISTKSLEIKSLLSFVREFYNTPQLYILEKITTKGYLIANVKLNFDSNGNIGKTFKVGGFVKNAKLNILNDYKVEKLNFAFNFNNKGFLAQDINLNFNDLNFISEKISIKKNNKFFYVEGQVDNKNFLLEKNQINFFIKDIFSNLDINKIKFSSSNNFSFKVSKKLKFQDFKLTSSVKVNELNVTNNLKLKKIFPKIKKEFEFLNHKLKIKYENKNLSIDGKGNILIQDKKDNIKYLITKKDNKYKFNSSLFIKQNSFLIEPLNYKNTVGEETAINVRGKYILNSKLTINQILLKEKNNEFITKNLIFNKKFKIIDLDYAQLTYFDSDDYRNSIEIKKKNTEYFLKGKNFNIDKIIENLLKNDNQNDLNFINKKYQLNIDIDEVRLDQDHWIENFTGSLFFNDQKIVKANINGNFPNNKKINFTVNSNSTGKITTLFIEKAEPIVKRYEFIKGFKDGLLDFYSLNNGDETNSTLKIYDFKLKELPTLTKILTLASLQGIADILSGEGIGFDEFEMNFQNKDNLMTIKEIYAIGPAISILLDGYVEKNKIVSLRGTLVPATTINKAIGSIPILGKILVGSETGEGVFGVSFKIKGPPKNLETTVNPIKTLTPRFITRTLEKIKRN